MINYNGYYKSDPREYYDSYSGQNFVQKKCTYLIFMKDQRVLRLLDKCNGIQKITIEERIHNSLSRFTIKDHQITLDLFPGSSLVSGFIYQIHSKKILIDEFGDEYHFHPWEE